MEQREIKDILSLTDRIEKIGKEINRAGKEDGFVKVIELAQDRKELKKELRIIKKDIPLLCCREVINFLKRVKKRRAPQICEFIRKIHFLKKIEESK